MALHELICSYLPASVPWSLNRTCARCGTAVSHGKPSIVVAGGAGVAAPLRLSTTRSGPLSIFAFTTELEVGVDVEQLGGTFDWSHLAKLVFSDLEEAEMAAQPEHARSRWGYERWVAKEAVLKGLGLGLAGPVRQVDTCSSRSSPWPGWHVQPLDLGEDVVAALATEGVAVTVEVSEMNPPPHALERATLER